MDDSDIKFRDQCAMQFMQILLARKNSEATINGIIERENLLKDDYAKYCFDEIEKFARVSYKFADIMRKIRLTIFE